MDVCGQLCFERLERGEPAASEELVLHMAEEPFHAGVVQAGGLARHALDDAKLLELPLIAYLLVLPALVRMQERRLAELQGGQLPHHLVDLRHVRVPGGRERHYLVVEEVHHGRQVGLRAGHVELGHIGRQLGHGRVGGELPVQDVLRGLAHLAAVRGVAPAPDPADAALLAHETQHRLSRYRQALLGAQGHPHLPVSHAVGRAGEDFPDQRPDIGVGVFPGVRPQVIVGGALEAELLKHQLQGPLAPQRLRRLRSISSAKALIRFRISFSSSSSRTLASSSSSRVA